MRRIISLAVLVLISTQAMGSIDVYSFGVGQDRREGGITYHHVLETYVLKIPRGADSSGSNDAINQYGQRVEKSYQQKMALMQMGVNKLPGVVIDHRYVIYGTTNVLLAKRLTQQYRGTHDE